MCTICLEKGKHETSVVIFKLNYLKIIYFNKSNTVAESMRMLKASVKKIPARHFIPIYGKYHTFHSFEFKRWLFHTTSIGNCGRYKQCKKNVTNREYI